MAATLGFYGGVGSVTGANFLLDTGAVAILIDCGLEQGSDDAQEKNEAPFPYRPKDIDVLIVTHAHTDHIGRIPKLVRDGFDGVIYSTPPTKALAAVMLEDALHIMQYEHEAFGRTIIFDESDIDAMLQMWHTCGYEEDTVLPDGVQMRLTNAGHILGSAMVHLTKNGRTLVCTGDVGNVPQPLMAPPVIPTNYQYLITESVYGDRLHEHVEERSALLLHHIEATRAQNGTLIIPAFSLERTQSVLYEINNFVELGHMEPMPVFLDSPLAIKVTDIYKRYTPYMNDSVQQRLASDPDIFKFPGFRATVSASASAEIAAVQGPKIIIAGSGMSHGGRIRRHEQTYLADPTTTLLLVGHQVVGSLGRRLQDGARSVTIDGMPVSVKAKIAVIQGYSGHADRDQLLELIAQGGDAVEKVFVTMGEERASLFLTQRIHDYLGINACVPQVGEEIAIDF